MKAGWEVKPLGAVCEILSGAGFPTKHQGSASGEYAFVKVSDMNLEGNEVFFNFSNNYIDESTRKELGAKVFPVGCILFPKVGGAIITNKKRRVVSPLCADNNLMGLLGDRDKLDADYLFHWMQGQDIYEFSNKSNPPSITQATVKAWPIPIPPLEEQKQIVAVLDAAFEGLTRAKENAEANLQNARELFVSCREDAFDVKKEGWGLKQLDELITIKHGFAFKSEFFEANGDLVLLTPGNYYETGGYRDRGDKQKYYVGEVPDGYLLDEGDLLVAMTEQAVGLLGSCILVPEPRRFLHNQRLGLIEAKAGIEWHAPFFSEAFNLIEFRRAITQSSTGIKVRHTSPKKIAEVFLPMPDSLTVQIEVAERLAMLKADVELAEENYTTKLTDIAQLRQSLLQKAFAGDLT